MKAHNWALATTMVLLATFKPISAEIIKVIADRCGLDDNSVQNIVDEVMSAKAIAKTDIRHNIH